MSCPSFSIDHCICPGCLVNFLITPLCKKKIQKNRHTVCIQCVQEVVTHSI